MRSFHLGGLCPSGSRSALAHPSLGVLAQAPVTLALFALILGAACDPPLPPETYALAEEVEVFRDSLGVVHIYAENDEDLFYASGYMQAVDRLFQMDLTRRRALGRRAEVLGADYVADDTMVRTVQLERWGQEAADRMFREHPDEYRLLVAWTAGVNARIEEVRSGATPRPYGFGPDELDYLPELWDTSDGFTVGKLILWGNANQLELDLLSTVLRDLLPDTFARVPLMRPLEDTFVLPPDERPENGTTIAPITIEPRALPAISPEQAAQLRERLFDLVPSPVGPFASNNWALEGRHTANGRPLIAGDPHQPLRSPSLLWMQHLNSADAGGRFDVTGFAFAGTPGVQLGHNRHIAWTATTNYPDISDIWAVRASASSVRIGELDVAIEAHEEVIEVAGGESVSVTVEEVPGYGVLLPDDLLPIPIAGAGRRMLYRWVGMRATQEAHSFMAMGLAEDLDDFEAAVDGMEIGCFNFLGATAEGIAYRSSPLVPDRGPEATERMHWTMLDGGDASSFWDDAAFLGADQLPHSRGGERGWIATANNDPFGFTADGTTSGDPFYFGVFFDPGTRAARIVQRLEELTARGAITPEEMQALQMDSHSVFADRLMPALEEAWAAVETDEALAEFRDRPELETLIGVLSEWDHELVRDSSGAVPFDILLFFAAKLSLEDDFALIFDTVMGDEPTYALKWAVLTLLHAYDRADELLAAGPRLTLLRALDATAGLLTDRFGGVSPENYRWGDHHGSRIGSDWGERLDAGWLSNDGGVGTINVSSASLLRGGQVVERLESTSGPLYRMVAAFGDDGVPQATVTVSRGNSGDPGSAFFGNTTEDWVEGNYRPLLFTRAEAQADAVEQRTLSPR